MAMLDYFKKNACAKLTETRTKNNYGNYTVSYVVGSSFDGLLVKRSLSESTVGAKRTKAENTYNLFVPAQIALEKDDKVRYNYRDGQSVFVRLTSGAILNEDLSRQTDWKTYEAESYTPAKEVRNEQ